MNKTNGFDLDSFIIALSRICNNLMMDNYFIEKIVSNMPHSYIENIKQFTGIEEDDALLDIVIDHTIIQLDQFFEIESSIRDLEMNTYSNHELTKALKDLKHPIKQMGNKIRKWRNQIVAHSKQQVSGFSPYNEIDPEYMKTLRNITFVSRLTVCYTIGLFANIPDFDLSMIKKREMGKKIESDTGFKDWLNKMKSDEMNIVDKVNKELDRNGFDLIVSPKYDQYPLGVNLPKK